MERAKGSKEAKQRAPWKKLGSVALQVIKGTGSDTAVVYVGKDGTVYHNPQETFGKPDIYQIRIERALWSKPQ